MACGIYKITNNINEKSYIGQSIDIKKRFSRHKYNAVTIGGRGYMYPLSQAIRKYGLENFSFEILEECSEAELNKRELFYYNLYKPAYCLLAPDEHPLRNPTTRLKVSKKLKGRLISPEHREKLRQSSIGANNSGARRIKGTHKKTGEILFFDAHSLAGAYCVERGLAKTTKRYAEKNIWKALHGFLKTAYGFKWEHVD